jgi:hypothetical protein
MTAPALLDRPLRVDNPEARRVVISILEVLAIADALPG